MARSGQVRVGTSGWSYPTGEGTWNGIFYPEKKPYHYGHHYILDVF